VVDGGEESGEQAASKSFLSFTRTISLDSMKCTSIELKTSRRPLPTPIGFCLWGVADEYALNQTSVELGIMASDETPNLTEMGNIRLLPFETLKWGPPSL
jgi:hypothetical protein